MSDNQVIVPFESSQQQRLGKYIVIEGFEGAGKTTQCAAITKWLSGQLKLDVKNVREPGGDPFGEGLRQVIKNPEFVHEADEELLVFTAARMGMRRRVVLPALESGSYVIADRSEVSTFVYQGMAGGISLTEIESMQSKVARICRPDLFIVLVISQRESRRRLASRGLLADSFESRDDLFQRRVCDGYNKVPDKIRTFGYNIVAVNGEQTEHQVTEDIIDVIVNQFFRPDD